LVSWLNYPASDNSWEPFSNLEHAFDSVLLFHQQNPMHSQPLRVQRSLKGGTVKNRNRHHVSHSTLAHVKTNLKDLFERRHVAQLQEMVNDDSATSPNFQKW
jgi:hypothetical protein